MRTSGASLSSGDGCAVSNLGARLEDAFKLFGPIVSFPGRESEVEVLLRRVNKREHARWSAWRVTHLVVVARVLTADVILHWIFLVEAITDVFKFAVLNVCIKTLPRLSKLPGAGRQGFGPALWAFNS